MIQDTIKKKYFDWLCVMIDSERFPTQVSYSKLLTYLHNTTFQYSIPDDENRGKRGVDLRYRFAVIKYYEYESDFVTNVLVGPCSILEMMVALAINCEDFMDDSQKGDRTGQWFWGMIVSLGLGSMTDDRFDGTYVEQTIHRFLSHDYEPNGQGSLFTIYSCTQDLRNVEIWRQMCWYLDSIT